MQRTALIACTALLWSAGAHAQAASAVDYTKSLIDEFKAVKGTKGLSEAAKKQNEAVIDKLDAAFDFDLITTKLMAPREDKFSADQKELFRKKFHNVIRAGAFVDTGDFFKKAALDFQPESTEEGITTVPIHVQVKADDTDMVVGIQWKSEAGKLRVIDVLLDGDSLVKDYQNQVARVVDKKGIAGLFEDLDARERTAKKTKYEGKSPPKAASSEGTKAKPE